MKASDLEKAVFINCPFDTEYRALFNALVFTVMGCGFAARCALEISNSGEPRIFKIQRMIGECRYGLHDLSRTELNREGLPRFNMPLELGMFLGAMFHGDKRQRGKNCLILDADRFRYQRFCSDLAGQDIRAHGNSAPEAITAVSEWLSLAEGDSSTVPDSDYLFAQYQDFLAKLPSICKEFRWNPKDLIFTRYRRAVQLWLVSQTTGTDWSRVSRRLKSAPRSAPRSARRL